MIRYALSCDKEHEFESWFPSAEAYDGQRERGLVRCPVCDSGLVEKQVMRPSVARRDKGKLVKEPAPAAEAPATAPSEAPQPVALLSERERHVRTMLKALREHVVNSADHVGDRFPDEARKMHYGDTEHRSIYGEATPAEARELLEEGVEIHPLPIIADDRN